MLWRIPNQYPQVVKTIHEGDPIAQLPNSEVTRSLQQWAEVIGRKPGMEDKKKETIKVRDLKPSKDAKGGGGHQATRNQTTSSTTGQK